MKRGGGLSRMDKREVPVIAVDAWGMRCKGVLARIAELHGDVEAWRAEELAKLEEEPDAEWEAFVRGVGAEAPGKRTDGRTPDDREAADRGARRRAGDFDFDQT